MSQLHRHVYVGFRNDKMLFRYSPAGEVPAQWRRLRTHQGAAAAGDVTPEDGGGDEGNDEEAVDSESQRRQQGDVALTSPTRCSVTLSPCITRSSTAR